MNSVIPSLPDAPHYVHQTYEVKICDLSSLFTIIPGGICHIIAIYGDPITLDGISQSGVVIIPHRERVINIKSTGKSILMVAQSLALAHYYIKERCFMNNDDWSTIMHNLSLDHKQLDKDKHFNRFLRMITIPKEPPLLDAVLRYMYQTPGCIGTQDLIARYATNARTLRREFRHYIMDAPSAYGQKVCFHACTAELLLRKDKDDEMIISKYYPSKTAFYNAETKFMGEHNTIDDLSELTKKFLRLDRRLNYF